MQRRDLSALGQERDLSRGPYDPDPVADPDLWFLPAEDDAEDFSVVPGSRAETRRLFDPQMWQAAQDRHSGALAILTALFGALDERLLGGPDGWRQRLALLEVGGLGWWTGERVGMDRLALWVALRQGATGEDAQAIIRSGWAVRRLTAVQGPAEGGWTAGLVSFLGRGETGTKTPETIRDMADIMEMAPGLHPVTQAAMLFHGWRLLSAERSGPGPAGQGGLADVEAAVLAARHGAIAGRGGAVFLPLALTGPTGLRATGTEEQRLGAWIAGATEATLAALLHLDRLRDWKARALAATTALSGRTPPALIATLAAWPMVSAPLAEEITGASRAAVQRNLDLLSARGLIREVTGQGRFRVWAAKV